MALMEADYQTTDDAMSVSDPNNRTKGDDHLFVKFYIKAKKDAEASVEAGRPIFKDCEYIQIIQPGNKENIVERPASEMDINRFPRHYQAFKNRVAGSEEGLLIGTPLTEWAGVTRGQVEELKFFHVRTVEQLAELSDNAAGKFMGAQALKQKAKLWLEAAKDNPSERLAAQQNQIDALIAQNEKLSAQIEVMASDHEDVDEEEKTPKKRK